MRRLTLLLLLLCGGPAMASAPFKVQVLSFNDFHGNINPPSGKDASMSITEDPGQPQKILGGSEYLATRLSILRQKAKHSITVSAGDLIGSSPLLSGMFHDEPTVEAMEAMHLDVSTVGNHEFDEGLTELLRMQNGGCHPEDGCFFPGEAYDGADFPWLAANVIYNNTRKSILPKTWIKKINGVNIGFIGMTLSGTPDLVSQAGIQGLTFEDEVKAANTAVNLLHQQKTRAIVLLLHEGGLQTGNFNGCEGISGPILELAKRLPAEIDLIVSGHTHQAYVCSLPDPNGRLRHVTSASAFGRAVTETWLTINPMTRDVVRSKTTSRNIMVTRDVERDAAQTAIISKWFPLYSVKAFEDVGFITASINAESRDAPSSLRNLVADSFLAATLGPPYKAEIAFINAGGIRSSLTFREASGALPAGRVTYEDLFNVIPNGNTIVTVTLTGDQIRLVLEEQYDDALSKQRILGVSEGLSFEFLTNGTTGNRIRNILFKGKPLEMTRSYQVTVPSFMLEGSVLGDGVNRLGAGGDLDALKAYMKANSPVSPPPVDRIRLLAQ